MRDGQGKGGSLLSAFKTTGWGERSKGLLGYSPRRGNKKMTVHPPQTPAPPPPTMRGKREEEKALKRKKKRDLGEQDLSIKNREGPSAENLLVPPGA